MNQVSRSANLDTLFGLSMDEAWGRLLDVGIIELVASIAILAIFVAVAIFSIKNIRSETVQQEPKASKLLSKFREQHTKGELSEEEFRGIKTTLAVQLKEELKDNGETG